jgi:predicted transcriptional regulator
VVRQKSTIVTLRVPVDIERRIASEARRLRRSRSDIVRDALKAAFGGEATADAAAAEARRQSLLVSDRASERDALDFIEASADTRGWR